MEEAPPLGKQWTTLRWNEDHVMDAMVLYRFPPIRRRVQVQLRDGVLRIGRRAFDQSQVHIAKSDQPQRLELQLATGGAARRWTLLLQSFEDRRHLQSAITRWLSGEDAVSEELDTRTDVVAREEERVCCTLALASCFLCERLFQNLEQLAVFFLACTCLGFGMMRSLLVEWHARQHGEWFAADCQILLTLFTAEPYETASHGTLWKVTGTHEVRVRFLDGCDDYAAGRSGDNQSGIEDAPDVDVVFVESYDTSDESTHQPEPVDDMNENQALPLELPTESGNATVGKRACSPDHDARLDPLRGDHVAYHRLVMDHDDFCYGPPKSNQTVALLHCKNTQAIWVSHPYSEGQHIGCFVFAKELAHGQVQAHVVLNRSLPWDVRCYLLYWGLLGALLLRLLFLCIQRCLARPCGGDEKSTRGRTQSIIDRREGVATLDFKRVLLPLL